MIHPEVLGWALATSPANALPAHKFCNVVFDQVMRARKVVERLAQQAAVVCLLHAPKRNSIGEAEGRGCSGWQGVDFKGNIACPHVDFATVHVYPDSFQIPADQYTWVKGMLDLHTTPRPGYLQPEESRNQEAGPA